MNITVDSTYSAQLISNVTVGNSLSVSAPIAWNNNSFNVDITNYNATPAIRPRETVLKNYLPVISVYFEIVFNGRVIYSIPLVRGRQSFVISLEAACLLREAQNVRDVTPSIPAPTVRIIAPIGTIVFCSVGQVRYVFNKTGSNPWRLQN